MGVQRGRTWPGALGAGTPVPTDHLAPRRLIPSPLLTPGRCGLAGGCQACHRSIYFVLSWIVRFQWPLL